MSADSPTPFQQRLRWLTAHAGFPGSRLPEKAELLLLVATAATALETAPRSRPHDGNLRDPNFAAHLRHYTAQRRRVHYKCDNSAKT